MEKNKTKVLFIMPRLPFPAQSGRKTSLFNYCKILSTNLNCELHVAAFLENGDDVLLKPDFIDKLIVLKSATKFEKLKNIVLFSFFKSVFPIQTSLFYSKKTKKFINELVEKENYDIVISDMIRTTEYLKDNKCYKIADLDDRISLRYKRQLLEDFDNINPYGAFINNFPNLFKNIVLFKPIKAFVTKKEIKLLEKYEKEIANYSNKVVFVAENETKQYNVDTNSNKGYTIPIGVDCEYFKPQNVKKENSIVFLGALSVAHNENAVINFIENIFPYVLKKSPECKFVIIGGGASEKLLNYSNDNVIFTGRVDDVRKYMSKAKIFVCPMTFGSGIKTKNLEAMALGMAVVTTSIGAENINAISGKDWIVEDENEAFANCIVHLMCDDKSREIVQNNARKFIENNFTWEVAKNKFESIINEVKNNG